MDFNCDACFNMRQLNVTRCPFCGKESFEGKVEGFSMVWHCRECDQGVASAGGFYPVCLDEEELFDLEIIKPESGEGLVTLARILVCPVLSLRRQFEEGKLVKRLSVRETLSLYRAMSLHGFDARLDPEMLIRYKRLPDCIYTDLFII